MGEFRKDNRVRQKEEFFIMGKFLIDRERERERDGWAD